MTATSTKMFQLILTVLLIIRFLRLAESLAVHPTARAGRRPAGQSSSPLIKGDSWSTQKPLQQIPRIASNDFEQYRDYYSFFDTGGRPILIEGALSEEECQTCCDFLLATADQLPVDLQQQKHKYGTQIFQCSLSEAIHVIMRKSNSKTAYLTFCEGLLHETQDEGLRELKTIANHAKEKFFQQDTKDWFELFPFAAQPTDAVILAGAGAISTLHRDPMEWTGTSLCLEGTKLWRFLEPPDADNPQHRVLGLDKALRSYRLKSIAWQNENDHETSLSAGWQSNYSLYHHRDHAAIPSAESLANLGEKEHWELLQRLSHDFDTLTPNLPTALTPTIHTVIQKPGDLLLIPAHWWHQTYAFEPSVAIASQRCGTKDAELVFQHILSQQQAISDSENFASLTAKSILETHSQSPETAVSHLFDLLQFK